MTRNNKGKGNRGNVTRTLRLLYIALMPVMDKAEKSLNPRLLVFDLDYTLWPFWVDTHVQPPFKLGHDGKIVDSVNRKIKCYEEVPEVLKKLHQQGYLMSVASRTGEIEGAKQLIKLFNWEKYFKYCQIYPGCKTTHIEKISKAFGVPYCDIIFFDDEHRNINDLTTVGVMSVLVKNGITLKLVMDSIEEFKKQKSQN